MNGNSEYDPDKDSEEFQSANPVICGGKEQTLPRSPAKASAVALLLLAILPLYFAAVVIMILLGLGDAARRTINQSLVMEKTDAPYQGREMSVFMMNFGLMPLGVLPAGILVDILGGQAVIGALGVALLIFTLVILVTQKGLRIAN